MSNSLRDQLLALGLAPKKAPAGPSRQQAVKAPAAKGKSRGAAPAEMPLDEAYRMRLREERQEQRREAERKRQQEHERRRNNQKIKALVAAHAVRDPAAESKRNFIYKGRIRSVLATPEQIRQINDGLLGVVYLSGRYHLLPAGRVEEIRRFAPDHVPDLGGAEHAEEAENPVPDDLIW